MAGEPYGGSGGWLEPMEPTCGARLFQKLNCPRMATADETTVLSADSYHDRSSAHLAQYAGNHVSQAFRHGTQSVTIQYVDPHASPFPSSRPRAGWLP